MSDAGCNPRPSWRPRNSVAPTGATGHQSVKRGENRVRSESDGPTTGSKWLGIAQANARDHPSSLLPGPNADCWACPKRERAEGRDRDRFRTSLQLAPAESAVLRPRQTDIGNGVTGASLSVAVDTRSRCQPDARVGGIA